MKKYNYEKAVSNDVIAYVENNINLDEWESVEDLHEHLYKLLWIEDSVTGNASGSYTFNRWEAEENLCHNIGLLQEALEYFGCGIEYLEKGAEACDVTIRCYLLENAIAEALDGFEDYLNNKESEEE